MKHRLFQEQLPIIQAAELPSMFTGLFVSPRSWFTNTFRGKRDDTKIEKSQAQLNFERKRFYSIVGAVMFMIVYTVWNGIVVIDIVGSEDEDEDEDEDEEEEDNEDDEEEEEKEEAEERL